MRRLGSNQSGFTIIELMVATSVFAIIILSTSVIVTRFTSMYQNGIVRSSTQDTARAVMDSVAESLQFQGADVRALTNASGEVVGYCVGQQSYSFVLGRQVERSPSGSDQRRNGLIMRQETAQGCNNAAQNMDGTPTGTEMIRQHMRLARFDITALGGGLYKVVVKVVYGDADLLNNPNAANAQCKTTTGQQFCAVSELSTVVKSRI